MVVYRFAFNFRHMRKDEWKGGSQRFFKRLTEAKNFDKNRELEKGVARCGQGFVPNQKKVDRSQDVTAPDSHTGPQLKHSNIQFQLSKMLTPTPSTQHHQKIPVFNSFAVQNTKLYIKMQPHWSQP